MPESFLIAIEYICPECNYEWMGTGSAVYISFDDVDIDEDDRACPQCEYDGEIEDWHEVK